MAQPLEGRHVRWILDRSRRGALSRDRLAAGERADQSLSEPEFVAALAALEYRHEQVVEGEAAFGQTAIVSIAG